ncbi:MAG: C40 family peptidase [Patescibacteria group bacterium]|nr:C40 family peptidase [Patescibacteria group bacterium]
MKVYYPWLNNYLNGKLPGVEATARAINEHAFEVEGVEGEVIDIKVTPNRGHDCLGHRGIAKELSAILQLPLNKENDPFNYKIDFSKQATGVSVAIADSELCRRYIAGYIKGVKVGPSPDWLKASLEAIGQRPINNVVDATNLVMFNLGQPMHAFDAKKLGSLALGVRLAHQGEAMVALDQKSYTLSPSMLVITAGDAPIGIAGVKGGLPAAIDESTTDIVLESANFAGAVVRKAAQALKLRTDASTRFEQELSPELCGYAMQQAVNVILSIAGGTLEGFVDKYPGRSDWVYKVGVSTQQINSVLGLTLSDADVEDVFKRFGWAYKQVKSPAQHVVEAAPSLVGATYKYDSGIRTDAPKTFSCSSLTNYLYVQAGIAMPSLSVDQFVWGQPIEEKDAQPGDLVFSNSDVGKIRYESVQYLRGTKVPQGVDHVGLYLGGGKVIHATKAKSGVVIEDIKNSSSFKTIVGWRRVWEAQTPHFVIDIPFERLDLRITEDLIEEVARMVGYEKIPGTPLPSASQPPAINPMFAAAQQARAQLITQGYSEIYTAVFADAGEVEVLNKVGGERPYLRTSLVPGLVEALGRNVRTKELLGLKEIKLFEVGAVWKGGGERTVLGTAVEGGKIEEHELKPVAGERYDISYRTPEGVQYKPFSKFPYIVRDIAMWVPAGTDEAAVARDIQTLAGEWAQTISQFDRFEKAGRVSVAYHVVFQSFERTLTEAEVNAVMEKVSAALKQKGFEIR